VPRLLLKAVYTPGELQKAAGLSRFQFYRLRRKYRIGRRVYLSQLQEMVDLWESLILRDQLDSDRF
jgi:hypothetical protein